VTSSPTDTVNECTDSSADNIQNSTTATTAPAKTLLIYTTGVSFAPTGSLEKSISSTILDPIHITSMLPITDRLTTGRPDTTYIPIYVSSNNIETVNPKITPAPTASSINFTPNGTTTTLNKALATITTSKPSAQVILTYQVPEISTKIVLETATVLLNAQTSEAILASSPTENIAAAGAMTSAISLLTPLMEQNQTTSDYTIYSNREDNVVLSSLITGLMRVPSSNMPLSSNMFFSSTTRSSSANDLTVQRPLTTVTAHSCPITQGEYYLSSQPSNSPNQGEYLNLCIQALPLVNNSVLTVYQDQCGIMAAFTCLPGYVFPNVNSTAARSTFCTAGLWNPIIPSCQSMHGFVFQI